MRSIFLFFACLTFPAIGHASPESTDAEVRKIEAVVEAFGASIVSKDKASFVDLFLHEEAAWQRVESDQNLRLVRQAHPDAKKVGIDHGANHLSFIDGIAADEALKEEKFWNVDIKTDGDIASVFFDYSFHSDGRETNRGKEAWHLVNTGQGWKIVSIIYSKRPSLPRESVPADRRRDLSTSPPSTPASSVPLPLPRQ